MDYWKWLIVIKHFQMNQILTWNNLLELDMLLNTETKLSFRWWLFMHDVDWGIDNVLSII